MDVALAYGSVLPAAVGAGCCVLAGRRDWLIISANTIMVLAMADVMLLGSALMSAYQWAIALGALGISVAVMRRSEPLTAGRAAHLGGMALLTAGMAYLRPSSGGPRSDMPGMRMDGIQGMSMAMATNSQRFSHWAMLPLIVIAAAGVATVVYAWAFRSKACTRWAKAESISSGFSIIAMAGMLLVG